ncbi:hypothetical protein EV182_006540, partial [Spiromyces aspiralis]
MKQAAAMASSGSSDVGLSFPSNSNITDNNEALTRGAATLLQYHISADVLGSPVAVASTTTYGTCSSSSSDNALKLDLT